MGVEAVIATQIIDTTSVGRAVMTAANAAAARSAIGAGTSSFDGAYSSLSGIPSTFAPSSHTQTASTITDFAEAVDDEVATLLVAGTNISITYNDAANTLTIASTASGGSPGGSSGQVQFNNAGAFGGMTAVVYAATGTHVAITSQAAATIPLCVKGAASQSGNLTEWQNSSGTIVARVTSSGGAVASSFTAARFSGNAYNDGFFLHDGNGYWIARSNSYPGGTRYSPEINAFDDLEITVGSGRALRIGRAFSATPTSQNIQATSGNGTNIAGSKLTVAPGASSGSATPAIIALATTTVTTSGTTVQTLRDVLQCDGNTTAGETPLLLLDIDKGTLQRVSIGASDSGGTGYKVLRIPN